MFLTPLSQSPCVPSHAPTRPCRRLLSSTLSLGVRIGIVVNPAFLLVGCRRRLDARARSSVDAAAPRSLSIHVQG